MTHMHTNVHAQREKQEKLRHILTLTHATPTPHDHLASAHDTWSGK